MSHKHARVLEAIFHDPVSGNIHLRDVESLLHHLGVTIESGHGARMRLLFNKVEGTLSRPHHSGVCEKHDIRHLREFLKAAGIGPHSAA